MKLYTYLSLLVLVHAVHDHYEHLNIDYVIKEATRLAYNDKAYVTKVIADNNIAIRRIIHNRDAIIKVNAGNPEVAKALWKEEFESKYADDFDKTLIASSVCRERWGDLEECRAYIDWDHHFDTRDETLRKEFLAEVHWAIRQAIHEVARYNKDL